MNKILTQKNRQDYGRPTEIAGQSVPGFPPRFALILSTSNQGAGHTLSHRASLEHGKMG